MILFVINLIGVYRYLIRKKPPQRGARHERVHRHASAAWQSSLDDVWIAASTSLFAMTRRGVRDAC